MAKPKPQPPANGRFAFDGLDRVLHEKARLGMLSSLVANPEGLLFNELKELCDLTDGNLSRHLQVLQESELVEIWKGHQGKRPQTLVRLTPAGRARFLEYITLLEGIVSDTLQSAAESKSVKASRPRLGEIGG
ncbi:transcriptional regulator [Planctomicrobium piriforme]|uniref:DNA-binding transcriptional regulator, MarR family n=1 Tax=Planctomicrobium piriforme TaxID=1576369 RepID=A0A1I3FZC2_9PLAN|nr:transcriptional regulator [Planctomicrobium piriforme]SFI16241.1 DNA-binding transcriptional regulator, MarR family [Planctomicrobium piriforme]